LYKKIFENVYPFLKNNPFFGTNIKKLKGEYKEIYRFRIGDYRLFYKIDEKEYIVFVINIEVRKRYIQIGAETAHNRVACALGLKPLGLRNGYGLATLHSRAVAPAYFASLGFCFAKPHSGRQTVAYSRNVMRNTAKNFVMKIYKNY
jgi:mRNA interferase RelE/StbE